MKIHPMGDRALLIEIDNVPGLHAAITAARSRAEFPRVIDVVPAARTVLVRFTGEAAVMERAIRALDITSTDTSHGELVEIDVVYDGPDLDAVAERAGFAREDLIQCHADTIYDVAFCGFAPGFAYLTGLDPALHMPRLDAPRIRVPAGSVAIAAAYTGVYPRESPGGWHLIGRSDAPLFDERREPAALLSPGMRVRFRPVPTLTRLRPDPPAEAPWRAGKADPPSELTRIDGPLEVVATGPIALLQDLGRPGFGDIAVGASGAFDRAALRLANRLLGNPESDTTIEALGGGLTLRSLAHCTVCITGATGSVTIDGRPADRCTPITLTPGALVSVGQPDSGLRSYLAVRGGFTEAMSLHSRSRDTLAGLGPEPLRAGDVLAVGPVRGAPHVDHVPTSPSPETLVLRALPGPRWDWFDSVTHDQLARAAYTVSSRSDRIGLRLEGPPLRRLPDRGELPPEGMVRGAVQVPPDGQPVLLGPDHPVTGGYPVIAVVVDADLDRCAQARPGTPVRFRLAG